MLIFADNSRWQHSDWKRSADDIATKNIFHCLVKRYDTRGSHHCVAHLQRRSHCRQLKFLRQRYKTKFRKFQLERNYSIRITLNIQHRLCKFMCDLWDAWPCKVRGSMNRPGVSICYTGVTTVNKTTKCKTVTKWSLT